MSLHALTAIAHDDAVLLTGTGVAWTVSCACGHTTTATIGRAGCAGAVEEMVAHIEAVPAGQRRALDPRQQRALLRTVADLVDGHINLWGQPHKVHPDRGVSPSLPDFNGPWWLLLVEQQLLVVATLGGGAVAFTPTSRARELASTAAQPRE